MNNKEEQLLQLWGEAYDRNDLIENVVFCPTCGKVSHIKDWASDNKKKSNEMNLVGRRDTRREKYLQKLSEERRTERRIGRQQLDGSGGTVDERRKKIMSF
jgi:uncharacterized Zn finger protein (UPF0148 family)